MTVLIISDEADFARDVVNRWSLERHVPPFAVVSSTVWMDSHAAFDLGITSPKATARPELLRALEATGAALICMAADEVAARHLKETSRALVLRQQDNWLDTLVLLGGEVLRRLESTARAAAADHAAAEANRYATLGRYMLDMRHNLNNALTSVLGHAELLLLEPGTLTAEMQDQIETIHSMTLRINEVLQRLSSLDAELQCTARKSETRRKFELAATEKARAASV